MYWRPIENRSFGQELPRRTGANLVCVNSQLWLWGGNPTVDDTIHVYDLGMAKMKESDKRYLLTSLIVAIVLPSFLVQRKCRACRTIIGKAPSTNSNAKMTSVGSLLVVWADQQKKSE